MCGFERDLFQGYSGGKEGGTKKGRNKLALEFHQLPGPVDPEKDGRHFSEGNFLLIERDMRPVRVHWLRT